MPFSGSNRHVCNLVLACLLACSCRTWAAQEAAPRAEVPSAEAQDAAEKLLRRQHAKEYADRSPAGRWALGRKLNAEAEKMADDAASHYVLLREARELAASCGDIETAVAAADALAARYRVPDALASKLAFIQRCVAGSLLPAPEAAVDACLAAVDEAVAAEAFDEAARACNMGDTAARRARDARLARAVADRQQAVRLMTAEHKRALAARETLRGKPGNAEAKLDLGRYLCWVRNDWAAGLALLAEGSDAALKALASAELASPATPASQFDLANRWWDLGAKQAPPVRAAYERHAVRWYRAARPKLAGPQKAQAEQRIEAATPRRSVNLLRQFDPKTSVVSGQWILREGKLASGTGDYERIKVVHPVPAEYDYRVSFTVLEGRPPNMALITPVRNVSLRWYVGFLTNSHMLGTLKIPGTTPVLAAGQDYVAILQVRQEIIRAFLNGRLIGQLPINSPAVGIGDGNWAIGNDALGVGTWRCSILVHGMEMLEMVDETVAPAAADPAKKP